MLLVWFLRGRAVAPASFEVATVEYVTGSVTMEQQGAEPEPVSRGARLMSGSALATGDHEARAAIRLTSGIELRFDEATTATLVSASAIRLAEGAIYVDTGEEAKGAKGRGIEVTTAAGIARDVGTQFEVRVLDSTRAMLVRVRDGMVFVERDGSRREVAAGSEMVVEQNGRVTSRTVLGWGDGWGWVLAASPLYDIEGRTLTEFLSWVARETGWTVRFSDPAIELRAREIVLHGTIEGTRPDEAPFAVLAGSGLAGELTGGVLVVGEQR